MPNIQLHNYQQVAKQFILDNPYCGLFLKMGLGKACDDDTLIYRPDGTQTRIGDIQPGDQILGRSGKAVTVTETYHHRQKQANQVILDDGRSFVCCIDHLIPYLTENGTIEQKTLKEIRKDYRSRQKDAITYKYAIPLCQPIDFPEQKHGITPYDFGKFIQEKWQTYETWTPEQRKKLAELQAQNHYRIPKQYLIDSAENRKQLFAGIMNRYETKYQKLGYYMYTTTHPEQMKDMAWLCHSLGYRIRYETNRKPEYLCIKIYPETENTGVYITKIKPLKKRNMTCFTVDAPDHLYLINDFIVTHNTLVTLDAIYDINPNYHVLVIAPKTIARCTWNDEIRKWGYPFRTKSLIVNKKGKQLSKKKREEIYAEIPHSPTTMYFINREMLVDLVKHFPKEKWPFGMVIIDESQSFKSYKSERFKALKTVRPYIFRLVELTGSPAPNGPMDLWSQLYLLDLGQRLGPNITKYRDLYFLPGLIANGYPVTWRPRPGSEDAIYDKISDIVISMKNKQLKLPPVTYHNMNGEMNESEYKQYHTLLKEFVLDLPDGNYVEATNAAVLQGKLSQIASGAIYKAIGSHEYEVIHTVKLELCEYIVNNTDDNILIAYYFQSDKQMILDYFKEKKLECKCFDGSPDMLHEWNAGKIKTMLIQPGSAGFGLNLQDGGATLIWYTLPWSLEQYEQTNARIYRQGQTKPVMIHHLIMKNTVDTKILKALEKKDLSQSALIDAVEAVINDI